VGRRWAASGRGPGTVAGRSTSSLASFMNLSAIEDEVLGSCADDYEAPHTIAADIARDIGRSVSEAEVRAAFIALTESGLVQAYLFDRADNRYKAISVTEASLNGDAWFFITPEGRRVADEAS
jgi:hypothetical protein